MRKEVDGRVCVTYGTAGNFGIDAARRTSVRKTPIFWWVLVRRKWAGTLWLWLCGVAGWLCGAEELCGHVSFFIWVGAYWQPKVPIVIPTLDPH